MIEAPPRTWRRASRGRADWAQTLMSSDSKPVEPERTVLVIGYGSTGHGDDGLGRLAAECLMQAELPPGVQVVACHKLAPELAQSIAAADFVLFLDAREGEPPGVLDCAIVRPGASAPVTGENMRPPALLALAEEQAGGAPPAMLLTVRANSFEPGEPISDACESVLPIVVECATLLTRRFSADPPDLTNLLLQPE